LLIVPVACVLVGISSGGRNVSRPYDANLDGRNTIYRVRFYANFLLQPFLLLCLAVFSIIAATGIYPIGGDDGRHDGIDELAAYLNGKPVATVIYDRWLDWELDYYMGEWTNKRRVYYPTPQELVKGTLQLEETGVRYFVAPRSQNIADWLDTLAVAEFTISLDYESANFRVYALNPP
jgi:hypothetical protein